MEHQEDMKVMDQQGDIKNLQKQVCHIIIMSS